MPPWLLFAMAFSLALAALYQLLTQRYGWRVLMYWALILGGFLLGEAVAESLGWNITRLGDLRILPDLTGALLVLVGLRIIGI